MSPIGGVTDAPTLLTAQQALVITWAVLAVVLLGLMAVRVATVPGADPTQVVLSPVAAPDGPGVAGPARCRAGDPGPGGLASSPRRPGRGPARAGGDGPDLPARPPGRDGGGRPVRDPQRRPDLRPLALGALGGVVAVACPGLAPRDHHLGVAGLVGSRHLLGSPWHVPSLVGTAVPDPLAVALSVLGWVAAAFVVALLLTRRGPAPSLAGLALVAVAIVLVTGTRGPARASLWLVPLAALAGVRWRDHLVWAACEGAYFVAHWLFVNGGRAHQGFAGRVVYRVPPRAPRRHRLAGPGGGAVDFGRHAPTGNFDRLPSACGKTSTGSRRCCIPLLSRKDRDRYRPKEAG